MARKRQSEFTGDQMISDDEPDWNEAKRSWRGLPSWLRWGFVVFAACLGFGLMGLAFGFFK